MALTFLDNPYVNAGKPVDGKYLNGVVPYASVSEVNNKIPISYRHIGLTVNVNGVEYWYKDGMTNSDLVIKTISESGSTGTTSSVTGATNIGFFSGGTSTQTLPISSTVGSYDGDYDSLNNNYYRDNSGRIRVGDSPSDGVGRRSYYYTSTVTKQSYSFVWNESTSGSELVGWMIVAGKVDLMVGDYATSLPLYYDGTTTQPYNQTTWVENNSYNNGSNLIIGNVIGNLDGDQTIVGARPYAYKDNKVLNFRSLVSDTPNVLSVYDDETQIHISGTSSNLTIQNADVGGYEIHSGTVNDVATLRRIIGSGDTLITQNNGQLIIYSTGGTSSGGGTTDLNYTGRTPSTCEVGGMAVNTTLTGRTISSILEEILVPTLYPTLTNPSVSVNLSGGNIYEIGCVLNTFTFTVNYDDGCINPQYTSACPERSNGVISYALSGPGLNKTVTTGNYSHTEDIAPHTVVSGVETWEAHALACNGVQPYDSAGNEFQQEYQSQNTPTKSDSIKGILPWYWGTSLSPTPNGTCIANCGDVSGGLCGKCVAEVTTSPDSVKICYNGDITRYLWFALPLCADPKTHYFVTEDNQGNIGQLPSDLWAAPYIESVDSRENCWYGCNYRVYVTNGVAGTETNKPMCMF